MKYAGALCMAASLATHVLAHGKRHGHDHSHPRHVAHVARQNAAAVVPTVSFTTAPVPTDIAASGIPLLASIVATATIMPLMPLFTSFAPGATPIGLSKAPALPAPTLDVTKYPAQDQVPFTNSSEVQGWLKEIAGATHLDIPKTKLIDGDDPCVDDPVAKAAAGADGNCWWTCGGCLRSTDISTCPEKNTWGVSYDDGPSDHSPRVLKYLDEIKTKATFFVVGSRVLQNPVLLQAEYLLGHHIAAHTWSHHSLTNLTNEEIVAELGWSRKIITDVLGVTPLYMRPPYGDLDDRVRSIAMAMGMIPIQWTGTGDDEFDTDDWRIPGNQTTGPESLFAFDRILGLANNLNTGFIVLEHDLWAQEVAMSVGYFLPAAAAHSPAFKLESINQCLGIPLNNVYKETLTVASNTTASAGGSSGTATGTKSGATGTGTAAPGKASTGSSASKTVAGVWSLAASLLGAGVVAVVV